jgi:hypothetical protein
MTDHQRGLIAGVIDTLLWASTVLYWPHLKLSSDGEILAQRLVWACVGRPTPATNGKPVLKPARQAGAPVAVRRSP